MIKYSLKCDETVCKDKGPFDGWFQNSQAYDAQITNGQLTCPFCGSENVSKSLMSPSINSSKKKDSKLKEDLIRPNIFKEDKAVEKHFDVMTVLRTLKKEVQKNAEFVGDNFANEAKAIKSGKSKERAIYGNAKSKEIKDLKNKGIDIISIPWIQDDH